tara:strand:- start:41 stop:1213 length:1173 start_codon:yes stop_codon:yes gene_type:complete
MAATEKGVWDLQEVRDKQLASEWDYTEIYELYSWGANTSGELGHNSQQSRSSPIQIPGTTWSSTSHSRGNANFATKTDGTLWSIGASGYGYGGRNDNSPRSSPTQIPGTNWSTGDNGHINGHNFSLFTRSDGTMFAAGRNNKGQLGQNNKTDRSSPTQIGGSDGWSAVSGCYDSAMALRTDGTLWTWGSGSYGKLGQNNTTQYSSPRQVGTDTTWSIITGNGNFAAIKTDGTLWSWGFNREGQLGHNTQGSSPPFSSESSPRQIPGTWQDVSTMREGAYGIKTDGTFWAWGRNETGQLGLNQFWNPTNNGISSPTQVGTDTTWSKVSAGTYTVYATKTDGTFWAWGNNGSGQIGPTNVYGNFSSPTQIPGNWVDAGFNGGSDWVFGLKKT